MALTTEQQKTVDTTERNLFVANQICERLGGVRKLRMFINAKFHRPITEGVQFDRMRGQNGTGNFTRIVLNGLDLYDITQIERRFSRDKGEWVENVKAKNENVYGDQLEQVIYNETGLVIRL